MATPARHFDAIADEERLLDVVRSLIAELGHQTAIASLGPASNLERELGLGSLERVELLLRIEQAFGMRLDDRVLAEADTVQDLIAALGAETGASAAAEPAHSEVAARAARMSSGGIAEGCPTAKTLQDVLRYRGRTDAAQAHLIFFDDEGESPALTFGELLTGAERVAAELVRRGIGRGDNVAIMLPTSPDFFLIFAGTLLAGATPAPIYPPFRADRIAEYAERQSAILANAEARLLVTFRQAEHVAKLLKPRVASLENVVTSTALIESRATAPLGPQVRSRGEDLALLQYTSGSTGNPKGVMLTHANLLANIRAIGRGLAIRSDDVGVSWLPLYHDMGLIGSWLMPLYFGLPVVILSPLAYLSRPARWLRAFHRYRGTLAAAPNFAYELAAAKVSDAEIDGLDLSSWRAALNGAEPVLPVTLDRFAARFARCGFRREALLPVYGLAESSVGLAIPPPGRGPRVDRIERRAFELEGRAVPSPLIDARSKNADDKNVITFVSVGAPLPEHEARIVDDRGHDAGDRFEGRIWFRGPSATQGYFRNDDATAALFPQGSAEGWINSGDRGYRAEGELYITGRVKDIIILAGRNLYPHEIEDVVAQVAGVRKGCVVAFGAPDLTKGTERLVVVAETRESDRAARALIAQAITAQVSAAVGVPPDIVRVVPPNSIPKTSSGKLQRDATKKRFLSGELGKKSAPAWLQIARLAAKASIARIGGAFHRTAEVAYGCYAVGLFGLMLFPAWLFVLLAPSRTMAQRFTAKMLRGYLKLAGWRVKVEGLENIREDRARMFVANHSSYADIPIVMAVLGGEFHFVAKGEVLSMPFFRTFLTKLGHFAFNRQDANARLQQAQEIEQTLRDGESVFVFPEGTFTAQSGVRAFHLGAFKAAIVAGRPIVPVALAGMRSVLRDGTLLPRRALITVTICPPICPFEAAHSDGSDWQEIVHVRDAAREVISRYSGEPLL